LFGGRSRVQGNMAGEKKRSCAARFRILHDMVSLRRLYQRPTARADRLAHSADAQLLRPRAPGHRRPRRRPVVRLALIRRLQGAEAHRHHHQALRLHGRPGQARLARRRPRLLVRCADRQGRRRAHPAHHGQVARQRLVRARAAARVGARAAGAARAGPPHLLLACRYMFQEIFDWTDQNDEQSHQILVKPGDKLTASVAYHEKIGTHGG